MKIAACRPIHVRPGAIRRFQVALSFSGEKRHFVAAVAQQLASRYGQPAILYDKFHEAEFARTDLAFYLPPLYTDSGLVVVILCRGYEKREWCGLEWDAIFDMHKHGKDKRIMLCRFD